MQRFVINTLIDITETKQFRHQPGFELAKNQQQNFAVLLQTIGLRANPIFSRGPTVEDVELKDYFFGSAYKGQHRMWTFIFDIEYEGAFTDEQSDCGLLRSDLHFVPIITGLEETINTKLAVFDTSSGEYRNTSIYTGS